MNAMWTTSLTCAEVAGFVRTLPVGVHSAGRLGCLRSLLTRFEQLGKYWTIKSRCYWSFVS